jgi:hypothetical protein
MTTQVTLLDEATLRRIIGEELDARLAQVFDAMRKLAAQSSPETDVLTRADLASLLKIGSRTLRRMELVPGLLPPPIRSSQRAVWWPRKVIREWVDSGGHIRARKTLSIKRTRG